MEPQDTHFRRSRMYLKNTSVFIGDNIQELFVFQYNFYCIFRGRSRKSDKDEDRKTIGVDHGGGGGGVTIYIYIYIYILVLIRARTG